MSRYRPPAPPKSNYLTAEGESRLRQELEQLWRIERPEVTRQVSDAAALGDRSENAEYIYGKKRLREIDRRVRYLRNRLESATVVKSLPADTSKVYFGAWVTVENEDGSEQTFRIVGPDEVGDGPGYISMDAPLGKALLGKTVDDEISINSPSGRIRYWLLSVKYRL
ncbi:transcription elongation factor GreB [Pseudohongiella spirulinae]|uniref:Transcription elongation factor GreB n=1 Tax=Pseudohongiella spirulinae TaxID=1249552 RepID=A0A0S2KFD5_9GAMM|nr:transcription elongation factor GreB [Pseudohongiella spirulinae]ALO46819.1 Transcription elongation factor GreB [Pseudohongiella spirulinae]